MVVPMKLARMTDRMPGPGGGASGARAMATPAAEDRGYPIPWDAISAPSRAALPLRADGNGGKLPYLLPEPGDGRARRQPSPRHPRPPDSQGRELGAAARLRGGRMDRGGHRRGPPAGRRHPLSRAASPRAPGSAGGGVGALGEQSHREVLPPEPERPAAAAVRQLLLAPP